MPASPTPRAERAVRPALPPVVLVALGMWCAAAVTYSSWSVRTLGGVVLFLALAALAVAALCVRLPRKRETPSTGALAARWRDGKPSGAALGAGYDAERTTRRAPGGTSKLRDTAALLRAAWRVALFVALGIFLGCALGSVNAMVYEKRVAAYDEVSGVFTVRATEDGRAGSYTERVTARIVAVNGTPVRGGARIQVEFSDARVWFGDVFEVSGTIHAGSSEYLRERGLVGTLRTDKAKQVEGGGVLRVIAESRKAVVGAIDALAAANTPATEVLKALVCGYRYDLFAGNTYDSFKVAGVGHLVAVSGAHLSVMFALLSLLLRLLRCPRKLALGLQLVGLLAFLWFSAIPISALRAAVMVAVGLFAFVFERRPAVLNALGVCIIGIVVADPTAALNVSFILSATSTLGIVLFAGLIEEWCTTAFPFLPKGIAGALALTIAASSMSLPFSIALFSQCSLVLLLSNILCAPLFTLACGVGLVAAAVYVLFPGFGLVCLQVASALSGVLCEVVRLCACVPYACIPMELGMAAALVLALVVAVLLWVSWPRLSLRFVVVLTVASVLCVGAGALITRSADRVIMFDVGQGDAILLQSKGRSILVDTGNDAARLRRSLARAHITRLDAVVISHADADHCGALGELALVCEFDRVLVAADTLTCPCDSCADLRKDCRDLGLTPYGLSVGDEIVFGMFACEVIWPYTFQDGGGNNDSLCLLVTADLDGAQDCRLLLTGDAGFEEISVALANANPDIDVLKVSHHGSHTGLDEATLAALTPEVALISAGANNRYGHPHAETLALLAAQGCAVYRTDISGDITLKFRAAGMEVVVQR